MADTVSFIMLGAGYFYIPINIPELCPKLQLV